LECGDRYRWAAGALISGVTDVPEVLAPDCPLDRGGTRQRLHLGWRQILKQVGPEEQ
jgi:hypothetical protein